MHAAGFHFRSPAHPQAMDSGENVIFARAHAFSFYSTCILCIAAFYVKRDATTTFWKCSWPHNWLAVGEAREYDKHATCEIESLTLLSRNTLHTTIHSLLLIMFTFLPCLYLRYYIYDIHTYINLIWSVFFETCEILSQENEYINSITVVRITLLPNEALYLKTWKNLTAVSTLGWIVVTQHQA